MLSVGFLASAFLTVLGFFLYALFSFRRRFIELGTLRAVGLSAGQLTVFLTCELAFLILLGLGAGTWLGALISQVFIPSLQVGARAAEITPPFTVNIAWTVILRIYVLFAALFVGAQRPGGFALTHEDLPGDQTGRNGVENKTIQPNNPNEKSGASVEADAPLLWWMDRFCLSLIQNGMSALELFRHEERKHMNEENTTILFNLDANQITPVDWTQFDEMSEEQRHRAALSDPDAQPATPEQLAHAQRIPNVRLLRRKLNLTQEQFARNFHLSLGAVRVLGART